MALADDLLTLAGQLSNPTAKDPQQAWLRRSVSTAYYALFQLLVQQASQRWTGSATSQIGLQRTFKHNQMEEACQLVANGSWAGWSTPRLGVPPELQDLAKLFVRLQEARHQADYNNEKSWTRTEVATKLHEARTAFRNWKLIDGTSVAEEFLLSLMIGKRRE